MDNKEQQRQERTVEKKVQLSLAVVTEVVERPVFGLKKAYVF